MRDTAAHSSLHTMLRVIDEISIMLGRVMALLCIVLVFLIGLEVVMRYFFRAPTAWGTELQIFMYGAICMLSIPYATYKQSHARVDIFLVKLPPKAQAIVEILYFFLFYLPFFIVLVYFGSKVAYHSWTIREYSTWSAWQPAIYPMRAVIPLAAAFVLLQGVSELTKLVLRLKKATDGDRP